MRRTCPKTEPGPRVTVHLQTNRCRHPASEAVRKAFDIHRDECETTVIQAEAPPATWRIGAIVGPSGSGKTSLARELFPLGLQPCPQPPAGLSLVAELAELVGQLAAERILGSVGLNSVPTWLRPRELLSTGERFRADLALRLAGQAKPPIVIDEYTSTVDRATAISTSVALRKRISQADAPGLVVVTAHTDFLPWLAPDWVIELPAGECLIPIRKEPPHQYPQPRVSIGPCCVAAQWPKFAAHHYLSANVHPHTTGYLVRADIGLGGSVPVAGEVCGIVAVSNRPGHKGVRYIHRIVILPQYQGLGIARQALAKVARLETKGGKALRITTSHPAMQAALNRDAAHWRPYGRARRNGYSQHTSRFSNRPGRQLLSSAGRDTATWQWVG
jgi:ABC-type lipoprotein export system ATPase subunit